METKQRVSNVSWKRHLPEDLWSEILSRLPVKSLVRFLCVSKSWLSLIKDPDFRLIHIKKFKNNRDETHLLVAQGDYFEQNCVLRCSETFKTESESLHTFRRRDTEENRWQFEYSIDGLVLLRSLRIKGFNELRMWNPSIRKFHDIPSLPEIDSSPNTFLREANIGFGYDPLIKDYKLVKLILVKINTMHSVAVYTLGAGSWRIIPFQGKGLSDWHWMLDFITKTVYLQGSLYFVAKDKKRKVAELVSVDLSSEVFSCTSLPSTEAFNWLLTLVDDGSRLAFYDYRDYTMWVLGSESGPLIWTKRYSSNLFIPKFLYHKKNGDLLIWKVHIERPSSEPDEELVVRQRNLVVSYNLETQRMKTLMNIWPFEIDIYNVCGYVESLVLV